MSSKRRDSGLFLLLLAISALLFADNEFIIESFKALPNDMSGAVYAKKDGNNEFCGLIKVKTGIREDLEFGSSLKFNVSEKKNPGEYWVYVSPGEGRLTLYAEGFTPKHFPITSEKIESKRTYELVVKAKEDKLAISIITQPVESFIQILNQTYNTNSIINIPSGKYKIRIFKEGYFEINDTIIVSNRNTF